MGLSEAEQQRRKDRYFFDSRRQTTEPESEGYGYDFDSMFLDLERAEAVVKISVCPFCHEAARGELSDEQQMLMEEIGQRSLSHCSHPYHAQRQAVEVKTSES
jgi:GTP cyclohydrolase FolE2